MLIFVQSIAFIVYLENSAVKSIMHSCILPCIALKFLSIIQTQFCLGKNPLKLQCFKVCILWIKILYLCVYSLSKFKWKHSKPYFPHLLLRSMSRSFPFDMCLKKSFFLLVHYCLYWRLIFITLWTSKAQCFLNRNR